MTQQNPAISAKISRITYFGEWAATLALLMMTALVVYIIYQLITQPMEVAQELGDDLGMSAEFDGFSRIQLGAILALQMTTLMLGAVMLLTIRRLFIGIRTVGVFVPKMAQRLRLIGWILIAMAPVSILSSLVANALGETWATGRFSSIDISFDDTDVYAIVIGLVIVIVSHIMLEAIRIYDENGAFV